MSQIKTLNGVQYTLPQYNDTGWGANTGQVLTQYIAAIADVTLQLSGGAFTLTADTNFGATYGLVSTYFKSRSANIADAGQIRLANTDTIKFRNGLASANLSIAISANRLTFEGSRLIIAGAAEIVNADVSASAAIAYSKLNLATSIVNADIGAAAAIAMSKLAALTASRALVTDGSGFHAVATTTATEIGYVNGVTSAIQTQMDLKAPKASPTFSGTITTPLTASRALVTGASSELAAATTTATEIGYVNGVTSAIQTQLTALNTAYPNGFDNGSFEIWQRGTSFSTPANGSYSADRWIMSKDGTPTFTIAREATTIDGGLYSMKLDITVIAGSPTFLVIGQPVENFGQYAGKTVTVSFRVKCSAANKIQVYLSDGVGTTLGSTNVGTGWETISATRAVSATALNLYCYVGFCNGLAGTAIPAVSTTYIDNAMLTITSAVVPFNPTNLSTDYANCRRFYRRLGGNVNNEYLASGFSYDTTHSQFTLCHYGMRITPTITPVGTTAIQTTNGAGTAVASTARSGNVIGPDSTQFLVTVAAGLTAGQGASLVATTTSAYIEVIADI